MELANKHHLGRKLRRSWLVSYLLKFYVELVEQPILFFIQKFLLRFRVSLFYV